MTTIRSSLLILALLAAGPSAAQAASISVSQPCYANGETATISGEGFAPDGPISFTVNGRRVDATVTTNSEGEFKADYDPPSTQTQKKLVIEATDGEDVSARTRLFVTRQRGFAANPSKTDNVRTWRAVFKLFGFGRGKKAFIHYVAPNGDHRKTVRLGRLRGPCGRLKSRKRRVLPFRNPTYGTWELQFDTRRRYRARTANKRVIPVRVFRA